LARIRTRADGQQEDRRGYFAKSATWGEGKERAEVGEARGGVGGVRGGSRGPGGGVGGAAEKLQKRKT